MIAGISKNNRTTTKNTKDVQLEIQFVINSCPTILLLYIYIYI
jgi:hypothetical protein